jgi:membrane-bound lytic murein transglycosylase B
MSSAISSAWPDGDRGFGFRSASARRSAIGITVTLALTTALVWPVSLVAADGAQPPVPAPAPQTAPAPTSAPPTTPTSTAPSSTAPTPTAPAPTTPSATPDFATWLDALRRDALTAGVTQATIDKALGGIEQQPVVLERDRAQAEFTLTLPQYLERRLNRSLVTLAKQKAVEHRALLTRVHHAQPVPPSIVVAVWALESNFGRFSGVRPTISVLATLAFDGRRAELFRRELVDALRILDRGDIDLAGLQGSWAGAMGQPQFLPSSYLKYAQDFDEDGRRNIWTSLPDVFASIAFYLKSNGWSEGESWGRRVRVPESLVTKLPEIAPLRTEGCRAVRGLTQPLPVARWHALGVRTAAGSRLPTSTPEASLLRADGEAFLVTRNYETLLTYNCAHTYALSVALLGDRLEGRTSSMPPAAKKATTKKATAKKKPARAPKATRKPRS